MVSLTPTARLITLITPALLLLLAMPAQARWQQQDWDVMGTRASVTLWSEQDAAPLFDALKEEMARLNALLSPWVESSELARVNARAGETTQTISAEFYQLLARSLDYYQLTDGAFDITFASAGHLYDYREGKAPNDTELAAANQHIGADRIELTADRKSVV